MLSIAVWGWVLIGCSAPLEQNADQATASETTTAQIRGDFTPDEYIRLALWHEWHGRSDESRRYLHKAVAADPSHVKARGLLGSVRFQGIWTNAQDVAALVQEDTQMSILLHDYQKRRAAVPDSANAHWQLARWCEQHGLPDEATAHLAHVTWLDPGREEAWKRLGYQKSSGAWMLPEQIEKERSEAEAQATADRIWDLRLRQWRTELRDPSKQSEARAALLAIDDSRAANAISRVLGSLDAPAWSQSWAVTLLGRIRTTQATAGLALLAVFSRSDSVAEKAKSNLLLRDPREYVGLLINWLDVPTRYFAQPIQAVDEPGVLQLKRPGLLMQRIYEPPARAGVSGSGRGDRATFDGQGRSASARPFPVIVPLPRRPAIHYVRQEPAAAGPAEEESQRDLAVAQQQMTDDVLKIKHTNNEIVLTNGKIRALLRETTGQDLGTDRIAWAAWWSDELGYRYQSPPPQPSQVVVERVAPPRPAQIAPRPVFRPAYVYRSYRSCFGGGTLVRTLEGLRAIETLEVGDRVLSQDTRTGALAFEPIVAVYHNPPTEVRELDFGEESIVATGIHRFWQAGRGWVMARDLKPGDTIRALAGQVRVDQVRTAGVRPVFNLEVADYRSFFVGRGGALVHDNTLVEPTDQAFDSWINVPGRAAARDHSDQPSTSMRPQ